MPNLLRCISAATARINTQNDRLDIIIIHESFYILADCLRINDMSVTKHPLGISINDVPVCIIDSDFLTIALFVFYVFHISDAQLIDALVFINLQQFLY